MTTTNKEVAFIVVEINGIINRHIEYTSFCDFRSIIFYGCSKSWLDFELCFHVPDSKQEQNVGSVSTDADQQRSRVFLHGINFEQVKLLYHFYYEILV